MTDKPENPLAFPRGSNGPVHADELGMTLRDWFAGQAMAGLTAACDSAGTWTTVCAETNAAVHAYAIADAMLAQRERTK